uniref:Uncharacterized protein n=1 Tax=Anguilla anguilla TaxID=7936 RepID=A0A0E9SIK6_ANGAN
MHASSSISILNVCRVVNDRYYIKWRARRKNANAILRMYRKSCT